MRRLLWLTPLGLAALVWWFWPAPRAFPPAPAAISVASRDAPVNERYRVFREEEARLTIPTGTDMASLEPLFEQREQLRRQRFSPAEQERLFADERRQEQWTLRRKALQEAPADEQPQLQQALELWLAEQPEWFRRSVENGRLLEQLRQHQGDRQWQLEQLGPEAADRLDELKQSQLAFESQLQGYLKERATLDEEQRLAQGQSLLERWFPESQWRRVEALTRIRQE